MTRRTHPHDYSEQVLPFGDVVLFGRGASRTYGTGHRMSSPLEKRKVSRSSSPRSKLSERVSGSVSSSRPPIVTPVKSDKPKPPGSSPLRYALRAALYSCAIEASRDEAIHTFCCPTSRPTTVVT